MPDLAERIRELVDGADDAVTVADVESLLAQRSGRRPVVSGRRPWEKTVAVATAAVAVAALVVGIVALSSSSPARVAVPASTPVGLDVPSTPKLTIDLPSDAVHGYRITWSKVPAYVPLYAGGSLIGYLTKASVEHPPLIAAPAMSLPAPIPGGGTCSRLPSDSAQALNVFNGSHVLIGQIYPAVGFVRLGVPPGCN